MAQAGLVSVIVGAGAAWFGLYVNSGSNHTTTPVQVATPLKSPRPVSRYSSDEQIG